jgi:hypothetical protein
MMDKKQLVNIRKRALRQEIKDLITERKVILSQIHAIRKEIKAL